MTEQREAGGDNQIGNIKQFSEDPGEKQELFEYHTRKYADAFYEKADADAYQGPSPQYEQWTPIREWEIKGEHFPGGDYPWGAEKKQRGSQQQPPPEGTKKKTKFRVCTNCGTTSTPSWRRSTKNKMLLCNACGLYQKLHGSDRPYSVTPDGKTKAIKNSTEKNSCRGCGSPYTSLTRKDGRHEYLCGSCGVILTKRQEAAAGQEYPGRWRADPEEYPLYSSSGGEWPRYPSSPSYNAPPQYSMPPPYGSSSSPYSRRPHRYSTHQEYRHHRVPPYMMYEEDQEDKDEEYLSEEHFKDL